MPILQKDQTGNKVHSGIPAMDDALGSIRYGDNVVWQVGRVDDFRIFADALIKKSVQEGRRIVQIRYQMQRGVITEDSAFAPQPAAADAASAPNPAAAADSASAPQPAAPEGLEILDIPLTHRFENFTIRIREELRKRGQNVIYVFDSLSELLSAWSTDLMMGNFFKLTGALVSELSCMAYYPVIRGRHSFSAIARIRDTTQLFLDVYSDEISCFVRPMKVDRRYSDTMFLPHVYHKATGRFRTATEGVEVSHFYQLMNESMSGDDDQNTDSWDRFFRKARMEYEAGMDVTDACEKMCDTMLTRDRRLRKLVRENFKPEDYFEIRSRMVGTGMIGGKACGMLLSRKLIENNAPDVAERMEPHDSFYIGSDVFYSYIVNNDLWELRVRQRTKEEYFSAAPELAEELKRGRFSGALEDQFERMLDYYGQDPFIVRSSSILEDGFGNAFAGKYDSVFCSNTGTLRERLQEFEDAVRTVYASTMSLSALDYRKRRGLEERDEQMALLVMRVSGSRYDQYYMPAAAGVGYSLSPYRFGTEEREQSGMLRLVMGLGTAAVDRIQGSYPRLVSMDNPAVQVSATDSERHQFSQRKIDVVNLAGRCFESLDLLQIVDHIPFHMKRYLLSHDREAERMFRDYGDQRDIFYVSCDGIVKNAGLMEDMKTILRVISEKYEYPVDIEFTMNIAQKGQYVINLLQCRPLQVAKDYEVVTIPEDIPKEQVFLECRNASMGLSRSLALDYIVVIDPKGYYAMPYNDKYNVAGALRAINWKLRDQNKNMMLFAPGRICTSSPELGVPSAFADISEFNVICEISETGAGYMPELSYGSHIFQDLVEAGILYSAVSDSNKTQHFDLTGFESEENVLAALCPDQKALENIVRVFHVTGKGCHLYYDMPNEHLVCTVGYVGQ